MTSHNPYVRPGLAATRKQVVRPLLLVEVWLHRLEDLLEGRSDQDEAQDAYDLLALWLRLRRVRPELLGEADGDDVLAAVEHRVTSEASRLLPLALTVPAPDAWVLDANALEVSYEELLDPTVRAGNAERVLADLDDAGLLVCAVRRLGGGEAGLQEAADRIERELGPCNAWLAAHADCFLAAGAYVQAAGLTLRPDLAAAEPDLARTAEKYVVLLDALEMVEADDAAADMPLPNAVVDDLVRAFLQDNPGAFPSTALRPVRRREAVLVGETAGELPRPGHLLTARAPNGPHTACLVWPAGPVLESALLTVSFFGEDGELAVDLAGQPVTLAGVERLIGPEGQATFPTAAVLATEQFPPTLTVGAGRTAWVLEEDTT